MGEASEIEYVRSGVCLLCGDGVLASGEHVDPERHRAEVERITSGMGEVSETALVKELRYLPTLVLGKHHGEVLPLADFTRDRIAKALTDAADRLAGVYALYDKALAHWPEVSGDFEYNALGDFLDNLGEALKEEE